MSEERLEIFRKGHILFSENDPSDSMYYIEDGLIGVYKNYGQENQIKVAEIKEGFFGEMAIAKQEKRTATAVILEDSCLQVIKKDELTEYFEEHPAFKAGIIKALSNRIRILNREYMTACGCISECMKAEENGVPKNEYLIKQMKKIAENVR